MRFNHARPRLYKGCITGGMSAGEHAPIGAVGKPRTTCESVRDSGRLILRKCEPSQRMVCDVLLYTSAGQGRGELA